jgi:hypothetical protein
MDLCVFPVHNVAETAALPCIYITECEPSHRRERNWYFNLNHRLLEYTKYNFIRVYSAVKLFRFLHQFRDLKIPTVIETWKATLTVQRVLLQNDINAIKYMFVGCVSFIIKKCRLKLSPVCICFSRFPWLINFEPMIWFYDNFCVKILQTF